MVSSTTHPIERSPFSPWMNAPIVSASWSIPNSSVTTDRHTLSTILSPDAAVQV
jgi:hypothetical protein